MNSSLRRGRSAAIVLSIGCFAYSFATSPASAATVSISSGTVIAGGATTVSLNVLGLGGGTALGAYDVTVAFDQSLLSFASASYGDPLLGDQLDLEGFGTISGTTPDAGTTEFFELSLDSSEALLASQATSFTLATLTFNGVATGVSPLTLSINSIGDQDGNALSTSLQNGSLQVDAAPVPLPAAIWLLASALGSLGFGVRPRFVAND